MSETRIVIIHGNGGLTEQDLWYPDARENLEKYGLEVITPTMPDNVIGRSVLWLLYMKDVLKIDENTVLVGHSTGAVAAARYAETHCIFGSVLVAAMHTDLGYIDEKRSGYFGAPWDWSAIKYNQNWIEQFASPNDPFIPIKESEHVREMLGTEYHELRRGHFQDVVFPELVEVIKNRLVL